MSWVGGDPGQLAEVGQRLIGVPGQISSGVTTPIANLAGQVCTAAGWTGAAADAFVQHWGQASAGATVVGALYDAAGRAVYELAEHLYETDVALHSWAEHMAAEGAVINADGSPGAVPVGPSVGPIDPAAATAEYAALRREFLLLADGFRLEALRAMADVLDETRGMFTNTEAQPSVTAGHLVTYGGLLRSFGAVPAGAVHFLDQQAARARARYEALAAQWRAMGGGRGGVPAEVKASRSAALRDLTRLREQLAAAQRVRHPIAKFLDVSLKSVVADLAPGAASALDDAAKTARAAKFLRVLAGLPVLEVAAGGLATHLMAQEDISRGETPVRAYVEAGVANAVGIGVGAAATAGIAAAAASVGAAPVVAVGVGAVVGGVIAVGVGEFVYQAIGQDWGGLIDEHGVLGGIGEGLENAAEQTGESLANMAKGVWNWAFG
jgi:hypothetical protein